MALWQMPFPPPWDRVSIFAWTKCAGEQLNTGLQLSSAAFSEQEPATGCLVLLSGTPGLLLCPDPGWFFASWISRLPGDLYLLQAPVSKRRSDASSFAHVMKQGWKGVWKASWEQPAPLAGPGTEVLAWRRVAAGLGCFGRGCSGHPVLSRGFGVNVLKMLCTSQGPAAWHTTSPGWALGQGWGRGSDGVSRAELVPGAGAGKAGLAADPSPSASAANACQQWSKPCWSISSFDVSRGVSLKSHGQSHGAQGGLFPSSSPHPVSLG